MTASSRLPAPSPTGLLEEPQGGVFFFDEIGDITPYLQAKLLEVIERKKMRRLGENIYRDIDVRYIFATNKNLQFLMKRGKFRQDLYYRITILEFSISPLRERKEDIPLLIEEFLNNLNSKYKRRKGISPRALTKLMKYGYPGNVRELENIIERAYVCSQADKIKSADIIVESDKSIRKARSKINPKIIRRELVKCRGNKAKTAEKLGISRQWLHQLLKRKTP